MSSLCNRNRNAIEIGCLFIVQRIFKKTFEVKALWVLLALLSFLHFQASLWLKGDRFLLTNNVILFYKPSFLFTVFSVHVFLSRNRLQNFLFTNLTTVVFRLPLQILWHPSLSFFSKVRFVPYIYLALCLQDGRLTLLQEFSEFQRFLLVYWSSLFLEISSSIIFSSRESTLDFNIKFSAFKVSIALKWFLKLWSSCLILLYLVL